MKTYDKEKLNDYAKELFALCLEKGLKFDYCNDSKYFSVRIKLTWYWCSLNKDGYLDKSSNDMPIWELIEKVKAL